MRRVLAVGLVLSLLPAIHAADEAKAILKRGIDAQGGTAALKARATAELWRSKGTIYILRPGADAPTEYAVTREYYTDELGRERSTARMNGPGFVVDIMRVFDGKKAWRKINQDVKEESADDTAKDIKNTYHDRVVLLHGLLEDKAFGFKALGESKVGDKPVLGVSVARKGHADTLLYFDKATGLLVKFTHPVLGQGKDGKKTTIDCYLANYRKIDFGAPDERLLKENEIEATSQGLLELVRKRAPPVDAAKKVKELIRDLGNDEFKVREQASKDLIALGAITVPALKAARRNADREVVLRASRCLLRINAGRQEKTLLAAIHLMAMRQVDGACEPLLALLPGANDALKREVESALVHLATKDGNPNPALVAALKDKDPARRIAAERVLGKDGGEFAKRPGRLVYPRGLLYAMKKTVYMDGKKSSEEEFTEVQFFNRFEDGLFIKP